MTVIPGRGLLPASPESITTVLRNDFRAKPGGQSRNDGIDFFANAVAQLPSNPIEEITPIRIILLNQPNLPIPPPLLDVLFSRDRVFRIIAYLIPNKPIYAIPRREARNSLLFVLVDTANEIVRNADIQRSVLAARQQIDVKRQLR
jgi:hypothetical protein